MKPRTLTALSVLVIALAAVVVLDRPRRGGPDPDRARLLAGFRPEDVRTLTLRAEGRPDVVLAREGELLTLAAPRHAPTDPRQVRDLFGTLESLSFRRRVPAGGTDDARARGLDAPRRAVIVDLTDGRRVEVRIGASDPRLGGVWVARADRPGEVYLVDEYYARALDRPADDLRRRDPLPIAPGQADQVAVEAEGVRFALRGRPRCVVGPAGGCARADADRARALEERLAELRVTRFFDAPAPDDGPAVRLRADGYELAIGGACPGAAGERAVQAWFGPACVRAEVVEAILAEATAPAADWVERVVVPVGAREPTSIELAQGDATLRLERQGGAWSIVTAEGRTPVDDESMRAWLDELTSFRAAEVVPAPPEEAPPAGAARVTVATKAETITAWLAPAPGEPGRVLARRPGEPFALALQADVAAHFRPDPVQFRDRSVLRFDAWALAEVRFEGDGEERLVRGATAADWRLVAPVELEADLVAVGDLRDAASDLRAVRVLGGRAAREHGLDPPRRRVTFLVDPPPSRADGPRDALVLELGRRQDDGACVARRADAGGDGAIFLLGAEDCAAIDAHFATRELLPAGEFPVAVTIGGAHYERQGSAWYAAGGARLLDKDARALEALLDALVEAPAVAGYGALAPRATVVVELPRARRTLLVASPHVALEGRPVRYRLSPDACAAWPAVCR